MSRHLFPLFALLASASSLMAAAPAITVSRVHNNGYTLYWGQLPEDVTEVRLESRRIQAGVAFATYGTYSHSQGGLIISNLASGSASEWRLVLLRGDQIETGPPVRVTTSSIAGPKGGAQNWREVHASGDGVELRWDDMATTETAYVIYRRDEFFEVSPVEVRLPKNSTRYMDKAVTPGKSYFYTIAPVTRKGPGILTHELEVRVPAPDAVPDRGPISANVSVDAGKVRITWTPESGGNVTGYSVQRRFGNWIFWFEVGRTSSDVPEFIDTTVKASASAQYRAVPFNANGVANDDPGDHTRDSPHPPGHPGFQEPVVSGSVIHLLDPTGRKIQRFDASAGTWQPPVELRIPTPAYQFELAPDGIYLGVKSQLYRADSVTGESHFLAGALEHGKLLSNNGQISLRGTGWAISIEPRIGPGIADAVITEASSLHDLRMLFRSGNETVFTGEILGAVGGTAVSRDTFSALTPEPAVHSPLINSDPGRVFAVNGNSLLLTDSGKLTVEGDSTAPPFAHIGKSGIRAAISLSNGGSAILTADEIVLFDRWWNIDSTVPAAQAVTLCEAAGNVWAISLDPAAASGWSLSPIGLPPAAADSAFWASPIPPDGLEEGETGDQILVHRASGTWRHRAAGSDSFGAARSAEHGIIDWEYDPIHNALLALRSGGLVTRHGLSSSSADWDRKIPASVSFMVLAGSSIELSNDSGFNRHGASTPARGHWHSRPIYSRWDAISSRLHYQTSDNELRTLDYATGAPVYPFIGLIGETYTGFLRISPDRTRAIFGGGFMVSYPHFNPLFQLPLNVTDAAWQDRDLAVIGTDDAGQHLLAFFTATGDLRKAFTLPGDGLHLSKDGDGWLIVHRVPGGGWRILRGDAALSTFNLVAGSPGMMPVPAVLPDATPRFPEWYEYRLNIGDPDGNGFTAVQEHMMAYPYQARPIQTYKSKGKTYFQVQRRSDIALDPFRLAIEYSPDLVNWTENVPGELFDIQHESPDSRGIERSFFTPKSEATKGYFRARFIGPSFDSE
ncbi:hypothetical protein [Luteolibacter luteus]|uniref:Fibronectin type-III domain-containing protein n=1 Tax=Luteolibacter luteus TaxID=2728835 RepID=A0A858RJQ4_9BACT|nr:hypothetical protein [Luteolibacter luteus]QJE96811.1 hypothetical protein HHL09_13800 [Luteolibacter luteus]